MAQCKMCKYLKHNKKDNIFFCEKLRDTSQENCGEFSISCIEYNRFKKILLGIFRYRQSEYLRNLENLGGLR